MTLSCSSYFFSRDFIIGCIFLQGIQFTEPNSIKVTIGYFGASFVETCSLLFELVLFFESVALFKLIFFSPFAELAIVLFSVLEFVSVLFNSVTSAVFV